jgi:hypothetical protein
MPADVAHVKAIITNNGGGTTSVAQRPALAHKPAAIVDQAPDRTHTKAAATTNDRAL